jgi:hypothetical protein
MSDYKKKLIEVALPLDSISAASRKDKNRKTGTIKNVHKWFAPMPTPAWRALLFAALVDDPGDGHERAHLLRLVESLVNADGGPPQPEVLETARALLRASGPLPTVLDPFCGGGSTLIEAQQLGLPAVGSDSIRFQCSSPSCCASSSPPSPGGRLCHPRHPWRESEERSTASTPTFGTTPNACETSPGPRSGTSIHRLAMGSHRRVPQPRLSLDDPAL